MIYRFLFLLTASCLSAYPQAWSTFLDSSRAIDWTTVGFTIPNYSANCPTQPTLSTGSGNAAANSTAIQNALTSCDSTHNVVNLPAGTYYVAGFTYGAQGKQVVRGAGPNATYIYLTAYASCTGTGHGACMVAGNWTYSGASNVQPPSGSHQCLWSGGYSQGTTSITLSSCGGTPPVNSLLVLDQANDTSDTNGVYVCDGSTSNCTYEGGRNAVGRTISGTLYSNQQTVYVTGVTSLGGGSYTVRISPALSLTNIRSDRSPGAWWPGFVQNDGLENLTLDGTNIPNPGGGGLVGMFSCYQCWVKNTRLIDGARNHVWLYQSMQDVIRDSYFYKARSSAATSYTIEAATSTNFLVENNIFQQVTTPLTWTGGVVGAVVGYNFAIDMVYSDGTYAWPMFASHSAGDVFSLFEGNDANGIQADNASGPADQMTAFRNLFTGWQVHSTNSVEPIVLRALNRNFNIIGNILGQSATIQPQYQAYATSTTTVSGGTTASIYDLGGGGTGDVCSLNPPQSTLCDPLTFSTLMRWGNYDTVNAATRWNTTEAAPASNTYLNTNFTTSYFSTLAHALPASLYYSSRPSWWPSGKAWPAIGPDVSTGNVGICTGTYAGSQATLSSQCTGGTLTSAWASHAVSIPAQDCYLNVMGGPPDGSGSVLSFDANLCSTSSGTGIAPPTALSVIVQ